MIEQLAQGVPLSRKLLGTKMLEGKIGRLRAFEDCLLKVGSRRGA